VNAGESVNQALPPNRRSQRRYQYPASAGGANNRPQIRITHWCIVVFVVLMARADGNTHC
jgi:hypothetical protein